MRIKVLGSGSAFSGLKRFNSCCFVEAGMNKFLIDCGSDALRAIQKARVDLLSIQKIFITHFHADHCGGVPAVLTAMHVLERKEPVEVYVPSTQLEFTRIWLANVFIFNERMSFKTSLLPIEGGGINLRGNIKLEFIRTSHLEKYLEFAEKAGINARSFSVIVREKNKKFFFSSYFRSTDEIMQHLDSSLALVEAAHPTLKEIADISMRKSNNVFFTHIPQELETGGAWRKELRTKFGVRKLNIVHDGQVLII
ncbi:MAG: MBL fold metallo-hydrolase [Candidatus Kryptoniota bacterium]